MKPSTDDLDELVAHEPYVRSLARQLVIDGASADDVVQQTWLAALRADRTRIESLRGWLGAIVKRVAATMRRSKARLDRRERLAARPEAEFTADDARLREDGRRAIVDAVFALDEPWRTTLILRHLDGVPRREIARRMGVPVETVHSRLRRGLELLRLRLDATHGGDRRLWLLQSVPFAAQPGTVPVAALSSAVLHGVLAMTVPIKGLAAAVTLAAVGCLWFATYGPPSTEPAGEIPPDSDPTPPTHAAKVVPGELAAVAERAPIDGDAAPATASPDDPRPTMGSLEVAVRGPESTPPFVVVVQVAAVRGEPTAPSRVTATHGVARFDELAPGEYRVATDRFVEANCVVNAGATTRVTLDLTNGYRISGRVLDPDGVGIADASIALFRFGQPQDSFEVAVSNSNGDYAIECVGRDVHVGATKAGYAGSPLRYVFPGAGESRSSIDLRLRPDGGAVAGRITDAAGVPLAGARVVVDAESSRYETSNDGTPLLAVFERVTFSDREGRYRVTGLLAGEHEIVVRASGFAPFAATPTTRTGETTHLDARLDPGAIVLGTVRAADGTPASGIVVTAGRDAGTAESSAARSAVDGSYRLDSLPIGPIVIVADDPVLGAARVERDVLAGVTTQVDLQLALRPGIGGRVEDDLGRAVSGARLIARDAADGAGIGSTTSGLDGAFRMACPDAARIDLDVYWDANAIAPALRLRDVAVGALDVIVRLHTRTRPSARIVGRIVDLDGPVAGAEVIVAALGFHRGTTVISAPDGSFASGLLPPGRYLLSVRGTAYAVQDSSPIVLEANDEYDAGTMRLSVGGSLVVHLRRPPPLRDARPSLWLERAADGLAVFIDLDGDVASASKVAPGLYRVSVGDAGVRAQCATIEIHDGEESRLDLALELAALSVPLVVHSPSSDTQTLRLRIEDHLGRTIHAGVAFRMHRADPFEHRIGLDPGRYRVTVEALDGASATTEFTIAADDAAAAVEMTLP